MTKNMTNYKREFSAKNYDRLAITIPKGKKSAVEEHAKSENLSVNGLVNELLREKLGQTKDEWRPETDKE